MESWEKGLLLLYLFPFLLCWVASILERFGVVPPGRSYRPSEELIAWRKPAMAKIIVIYGPMFSGKTKELIDLYNKAEGKKLAFKNATDSRTKTTLSSHDPELNDKIAATSINSLYQIEEYVTADTKWVFVDEAQFFDTAQAVKFINKIKTRELSRDITYVFCGLDLNFKGVGFETINYLIQKADDRIWKLGVCKQCGDAATHSYLTVPVASESVVVVGGADKYEPRCQNCFDEGAPREATA